MAAEQKDAKDPDYEATDDEEDDEEDMKEMELKFSAPPKARGRQRSVFSSNAKVDANWTPPVYDKSPAETSMLEDRVSRNALMRHLDKKEVTTLVNAFQARSYEPGDEIITQGDEGNTFYIVEDGHCDITVTDVGKVKDIDGGEGSDFFGELALLYDAPRAATVTATTPVRAWGLDRTTFKSIMQDAASKQSALYRSFLEQVPILSSLSTYERLTIADALKSLTFRAGEDIIVEGTEGNAFFIVAEGVVQCFKQTDDGSESAVSGELGKGTYFGELALLNDDLRKATVRALVDDTKCLALDRDTFKRVLGPLEDILAQNQEIYDKYVAEAK